MSARMLEVVEPTGEHTEDGRSPRAVPRSEDRMNETSNTGRGHGRSLWAFLLGAATGGLAGLLLAPVSGRELRGRISEEARKATDDATEMAHKTREKATEVAHKTQERATELSEKAQEKVRAQYEETAGRAWQLVDDTKGAAEARKEALKEAWQEGKAAYERELTKDR